MDLAGSLRMDDLSRTDLFDFVCPDTPAAFRLRDLGLHLFPSEEETRQTQPQQQQQHHHHHHHQQQSGGGGFEPLWMAGTPSPDEGFGSSANSVEGSSTSSASSNGGGRVDDVFCDDLDHANWGQTSSGGGNAVKQEFINQPTPIHHHQCISSMEADSSSATTRDASSSATSKSQQQQQQQQQHTNNYLSWTSSSNGNAEDGGGGAKGGGANVEPMDLDALLQIVGLPSSGESSSGVTTGHIHTGSFLFGPHDSLTNGDHHHHHYGCVSVGDYGVESPMAGKSNAVLQCVHEDSVEESGQLFRNSDPFLAANDVKFTLEFSTMPTLATLSPLPPVSTLKSNSFGAGSDSLLRSALQGGASGNKQSTNSTTNSSSSTVTSVVYQHQLSQPANGAKPSAHPELRKALSAPVHNGGGPGSSFKGSKSSGSCSSDSSSQSQYGGADCSNSPQQHQRQHCSPMSDVSSRTSPLRASTGTSNNNNNNNNMSSYDANVTQLKDGGGGGMMSMGNVLFANDFQPYDVPDRTIINGQHQHGGHHTTSVGEDNCMTTIEDLLMCNIEDLDKLKTFEKEVAESLKQMQCGNESNTTTSSSTSTGPVTATKSAPAPVDASAVRTGSTPAVKTRKKRGSKKKKLAEMAAQMAGDCDADDGGGVRGRDLEPGEMTTSTSTRRERLLHYCSICTKCFKDKYSVNVHIRTHTGEKPFSCPLCGKNFRQKAHLAKHQQTHTKLSAGVSKSKR